VVLAWLTKAMSGLWSLRQDLTADQWLRFALLARLAKPGYGRLRKLIKVLLSGRKMSGANNVTGMGINGILPLYSERVGEEAGQFSGRLESGRTQSRPPHQLSISMEVPAMTKRVECDIQVTGNTYVVSVFPVTALGDRLVPSKVTGVFSFGVPFSPMAVTDLGDEIDVALNLADPTG